MDASSYKMPDYYLKLEGPTCVGCTNSIKAVLSAINVGVVDIDLNGVIVSLPDEESLPKVYEAIEDASFKATLVNFTPKSEQEPAKEELFPSLPAADSNINYFLYSAILFAIGLPLMIIGMLGMIPSPIQPIGQFIGIVLSIVTAVLVGFMTKYFFKAAWQEIKNKHPGMNTLFVLGSSTAFLYSVLVVAMPGLFGALSVHADFAAVFIIAAIVCFGQGVKNYLDRKTREKAKNILNFKSIFEEWQPLYVFKMENGKQPQEVYFKDVKVGDKILITPEYDKEGHFARGRSGVDGIYRGESAIEVISPHTGESGDCKRLLQPNGEVLAGTQFILQPGTVAIVEATQSGENSSLYKRLHCAATTVNTPAPYPMAQKISRWFTPLILACSLISGVLWGILGPAPSMAYAIVTSCSVLLCACPCAFALASPISTLIAAFKAMQKGIFIHKLSALEKAGEITTVIFDKTGTLTDDVPTVEEADVAWAVGVDATLVGQALVAVESNDKACTHPAAKAILKYADKVGWMKLTSWSATHFKYQEKKKGVSAIVGENQIQVGQFDWFLEQSIASTDAPLYEEYLRIQKTGASPVCIALNGAWVGILPLKAKIKNEKVKQTIAWLQSQKIKIKMLTGDESGVASRVAQELGIEQTDILAQQTPEDKKQYIIDLKRKGEIVAFLGDGYNDILAIQEAHVGIAVEEGVNATVDPHVVFQNGDLSCLKSLMTISKKLKKNIKQNLIFAMIYNFASILLAAGLLFPIFGVLGNPVVASIAMGISSIIVILNAARLRGTLNQALSEEPKTLKQQIYYLWKTAKPFTKGLIAGAGVSLGCVGAGTICALACGMSIGSLFSLSAMSSMMAFCGVMMMTGYVGLGIVAALLICLLIYKGVQYYKAKKKSNVGARHDSLVETRPDLLVGARHDSPEQPLVGFQLDIQSSDSTLMGSAKGASCQPSPTGRRGGIQSKLM